MTTLNWCGSYCYKQVIIFFGFVVQNHYDYGIIIVLTVLVIVIIFSFSYNDY